jgi:hypothetical protein
MECHEIEISEIEKNMLAYALKLGVARWSFRNESLIVLTTASKFQSF